ncbi:cytochrome P450 71A1-like isoform X2 [Asparagus officinalis]|uniref:cytochrome P450 71A1-like isoform X2 n=1 Tax=Asparagus officinalis TaxID=4686 RepID=UPI00098E23D5|nr:cytochrome P450 71A1-like isoform X2 [Asparagus officinalis]
MHGNKSNQPSTTHAKFYNKKNEKKKEIISQPMLLALLYICMDKQPHHFHSSQEQMAVSVILLLLLSFIIILPFLLSSYKSRSKSKPNAPPGPRPLPIIGNLHQVGPIAHRSFYILSKTYGPLFRLNLGKVPALVISSPSVAQQVLKTHDLAFCSRPPLITFQEYSFNGCDVAAAAYGDHWCNLRKIFILELLSSKKLPSFVSAREQETQMMVESIKARADDKSVVNITAHMIRMANNLICRVAFGYKDEGFGWIDLLTGQMRRLKRNSRKLDEFYQEVIDQHLKDGEKEESSEEYIVDVMLRLWKEGEQLSMDHIKGALMNIFIAGTDTSAATVIWAMSELMRNPAVMKKAQRTVREVVGNKGKVEEADLPKLRYIRFVINETLRLHPPLPLLIPRETTQHCKINGYDIDPKTRVFVSAWAIGRDEESWENPEEFNPDRFIGISVDYKGHDFKFLPFGAGRRICPGINFGVASAELALANLLNAFNWELPPGTRKEDIDMFEAPGVVAHKNTDLCLVAANN